MVTPLKLQTMSQASLNSRLNDSRLSMLPECWIDMWPRGQRCLRDQVPGTTTRPRHAHPAAPAVPTAHH
eukprot:COSAG02_NODE_8077_length_2720_cov_1.261732_1_plen_68_part_10